MPADPEIDDGRKPTFLSSLFSSLESRLKPKPPVITEEPDSEPEPDPLERDALVELETVLPDDLNVRPEAFAAFLRQLNQCSKPIAFELLGLAGRVVTQFAARPGDASIVRRQLTAYFPEAVFQPREGTLERAWTSCAGEEMLVVEFGLAREFIFQLASGKVDPFIGIIGALSELRSSDLGLFQVLFQPVQEQWAESIVNSVTHADGKPLFVNQPELASAAEDKVKSPLHAAVVRIAAKAELFERVLEIARDLAGSLRVFSQPQGNELIPLKNDDYPFYEHIEDVLRRQSRRSGMVLNSDELIGFVHLPSSDVRSLALKRDTGKTKTAPAIVRNTTGLLLGDNIHFGESIPVRLSPEQRVRHMHIIGATGTGKSTLLFNLIRQDIETGQGVAVLDPAGDLIERILGVIYQSDQLDKDGFGKFHKPLEERRKQLEEALPRLQGELDVCKIKKLSTEEVALEAANLYKNWPTLKPDERREIVEAIVQEIMVGKGEVTINLCYIPASKELALGWRKGWDLNPR